MSSRDHHPAKRRRLDVDPDALELDLDASVPPNGTPVAEDLVKQPTEQPPEEERAQDVDPEKLAKQCEIWEAFKEENYGVLEQLPLSLHRYFTLIRELDEEVEDNRNSIVPAIKRYVALRRSIAGVVDPPEEPAPPEVESNAAPVNAEGPNPPDPVPTNGAMTNGHAESRGETTTPDPEHHSSASPTPPSTVDPTPASSRDLLIGIAQSADAISRAANEKSNVAKFAYELVDRYIRELDRAIKEQEASISLGLRPGTHPASIILPEIVVPRGNRGRIMSSPAHTVIDLSEEVPEVPVEEAPVVAASPPRETTEEVAPGPSISRGRKRGKGRGRKGVRNAGRRGADEENEPEPPTASSSGLTLTIPARPPPQEPVDPNEPRYCFCNDVSYGEMVGCDNDECKREWFHFGCVGLKQAPVGSWYCSDCSGALGLTRPNRRKSRAR